MRATTNDIHFVWLTEQIFNVELFQPGNTMVTEFNEDGIVTYYTEYKSRKRKDVIKIAVDRNQMQTFFDDLYMFVRNADESSTPVDDCSYKLTLYYNNCHKEIFEGDTTSGGKSMLGMLYRFVEAHGC